MTESFVESVMVDFQPINESDNHQVYGTSSNNTYKLFCELDTDIKMGDTVMIHDELMKYTVVGEPKRFFNVLPHMEVLVKIQDNK